MASKLLISVFVVFVAYMATQNVHWVSIYQVSQAVKGVSQLFSLPQEDVDACVEV